MKKKTSGPDEHAGDLGEYCDDQLNDATDVNVNADVRADVLRLSIAVQRMQMLATKSGLIDANEMDEDGIDIDTIGAKHSGQKHSRPLSSSTSHMHSHSHGHGRGHSHGHEGCSHSHSRSHGVIDESSVSGNSHTLTRSINADGRTPEQQVAGALMNELLKGNADMTVQGVSECTERDASDAASDSESLRSAFGKLEKMLRSESSEIQLEATKKFRQLLSMERDPMLQELVDRDIVPQLLHFLKDKSDSALQVEALWALTNIAAGTHEHTHLLIKNNAVPTLVSLLMSQHHEVLEQAVWVLGNIAGDDATARDTVLSAGALEPLLKCMDENRKPSFLRIATWTLSNLCDGQPRPIFDVVAVLNTVKKVLDMDDTEVLSHACWALSHLCDGPSPHIQDVVKANVCPRLVELLRNKAWRVVKPALRTVGNIVCAEDDQDYTQHIIECGAVPCLRQLIGHSNREIQKEACWTISNISAGTVDQIQCVLDSGGIPPLVELASEEADTDPDVKIEACWVLLNATSCGSDQQIEQLVRAGCVQVLCNLLRDTSMVMMALEGLEKILQVGEDIALKTRPAGTNPHAILLDTKKIEALQHHRSTAISKRANRMWKQHFVTCAICETAYSRHSPSTSFCDECKCNVCSNCDCSVFHLSYQDQLWREMAEGEQDKEKAKQESKKTKRQKKRAKEKKKKEMAKALKDGGNKNGSNLEIVNSNDNHQTSKDKKKDSAPTFGNNDKPSVESPCPPNAAKNNTKENSELEGSDDIEKSGDDNVTKTKEAPNGAETKPKSMNGGPKVAKKNEQYVDFLMQTGSILDLWNMMNDGDDLNQEAKRAHVKSNSKG
mmetsp:Transcript_17259/g.22025  ORF Transcript_17259/g.22025 Transcript_17259/m.22025 type:complete len:837 (+) Transcript_17259:356-2866(+)|eukprot:CAMPEP_0204874242 /NCGR_PEP_ID=MMETSP1348-20121228/42668_1 /ASSEMBLY_ACC=CAM_ASM_000700 /TAXON_ID=215587 /ORGANISM="Aplanochytrium stocchinoi, Strain GSBS06" /LENGTH=836 /DNA_ID=CAMNT_0052029963 /DNA_START=342 /DNA_END=2852 /DNA_ORIENTATION=-